MIESIESEFIFAASDENFKSLVLDNSQKGPVLVNFWSKKAGPCLRQYPILDKLIHQFKGRLLLVNVNTEQVFKTTKEYSIASVPTLKLFRQGVVVETLHGYQSENDLAKVLNQYIARDSDQALADAIHQYSQGHDALAFQMISQAIIDDPKNINLPIALCKLLKHEQRFNEAQALLDALPEQFKKHLEVIKLREELDFIVIANNIQDLDLLILTVNNKQASLQELQQLSAFYVLNKEYHLALELLVEIMERDKTFDDGYPRVAMLKIFKILGQGHDLVSQFRPSLRCYAH